MGYKYVLIHSVSATDNHSNQITKRKTNRFQAIQSDVTYTPSSLILSSTRVGVALDWS